MAKFVLIGTVFAFIASFGVGAASAQDISGRWIHTENSAEWLTTNISEFGNGIFRWTLLTKNQPTGRAQQTTCVGQYRYDGRVVTTRWDSSCQACENDVCAPTPSSLLLSNGACAIQWQGANAFVNCQGQAFHRY